MRTFWIFIVVLLCAAGYAGYLLATWSIFQPRVIAVAGNLHVSPAQILSKAAIPQDRNVWLWDKRGAERRIDAIPWVRATQIHRGLPANVRIVVEERKPAACIQSGKVRYLVDETAHVIEIGCERGDPLEIAWPMLPQQAPGAVLDAALLARMLSDAATLQSGGLEPRRLELDRFDGLDADLRDGLHVRFGDDRDLAKKAALIPPILRAYAGHAQALAGIDLRAPATPVVELRRPKK